MFADASNFMHKETRSYIKYFADRLKPEEAFVLPLQPPEQELQYGIVKTVNSAQWLASMEV